VGVTAEPASQALIRKEAGGVVAVREGRVTVRGSSLAPLALAEAALRALASQHFS
jgi:hypothetical protein